MGDLRFNCGEFKPGKKRIYIDNPPPPGGGGDINPEPIKKCCTKVPKDIVPPGEEDWTCVCETPCLNDPSQCSSGRKCIRVSELRKGQLHGRFFPNKDLCENQAYGEAPCYLCSVNCVEISAQVCPPPHEDKLQYIRRECRWAAPGRDRVGAYPDIATCVKECKNESFECPPPPPITIPRRRRGVPITQPPGEARFKCEVLRTYLCPDGVSKRRIERECKVCVKNKDGTWPEGCIFLSISNCRDSPCKTEDFICPPITGGGRTIGGGGGGPITPPRRQKISPPITPTPKWKCDVQTSACGDGTTIKIRTCVECALDVDDPECVYANQNKCKEKCKSEECPKEPPDEPGSDGGGVQSNNNNRTIIDITKLANQNRVANNKKELLYHPYYNLLDYPVNPEIVLITNNRHLNIFSNKVAREIDYILKINNSQAAWKEYPYTQITPEKIKVSLNKNLLIAFQNIHFRDNSLVPEDAFLEMVWRLLATNRLDDLDSMFYIGLANDQKNDEIIEFVNFGDNQIKSQAALGIVSQDSISTDPSKLQDFQTLQLRRARFLNEDLNTNIPVTLFEGVVEPLPLGNEGLTVIIHNEGSQLLDEASEEVHVDLGEGDGYYLSALLDNGQVAPLVTRNDLSSSYYVPEETKEQSLKILGEGVNTSYYVTSLQNRSEFDDNYGTPPGNPMYFKLDLGSIVDNARTNQLVDSVSGQYVRLTSTKEINEHARSYGFGAVSLNIDYDDPFLVYAKESERIGFATKQISFRAFYPAKTNLKDQKLVRTIPFVLIVTPGKGSKHNPFANRSTLTDFETNTIRELKTVNTFITSKNRPPKHPLDLKTTFEVLGTFYIGLVGKQNPDTQNVVYTFNTNSERYKKRYFYNGVYNDSPPSTVPVPITRRVVYEIITKVLFEKYSTDGLTSWDVFRRLTAEEMARVSFEFTDRLQTSLKTGFKNIRIRTVLNRLDTTETGILGESPEFLLRLEGGIENYLLLENDDFLVLDYNTDAEDIIYINLKDRINAKSY